MEKTELDESVRLHGLWFRGDEGGKKAKWDKDAVFKFQIGNK
jgi:hypothetical protein